MEKDFEYPRTEGDEQAEHKEKKAAIQGKWDAFNQPDVKNNGISTEESDKLAKKYFGEDGKKRFESSADEEMAEQDHESEQDELYDDSDLR